jgi:hypothetical protein
MPFFEFQSYMCRTDEEFPKEIEVQESHRLFSNSSSTSAKVAFLFAVLVNLCVFSIKAIFLRRVAHTGPKGDTVIILKPTTIASATKSFEILVPVCKRA